MTLTGSDVLKVQKATWPLQTADYYSHFIRPGPEQESRFNGRKSIGLRVSYKGMIFQSAGMTMMVN